MSSKKSRIRNPVGIDQADGSGTVKMRNLATDALSGMVVFIVAVPLSLGIALASGMPPVSALVSAIIGGIIVGAISGAPIVVSGPAAGLSAMVLGYVTQFGIETVYRITMIAGILQIAFGLLRFGRFISRIPKPILEGVLSAIGLTILLSQLHVLMGQPVPGGVVANILSLPNSLDAAIIPSAPMFLAPALFCGMLTMTVQVLWPRYFRKLKWLPAALPATLVGTLVIMNLDVPRVAMSPLLTHLNLSIDKLFSSDFLQGWSSALVPAIGLAIVASAESLLTARAIDILVKSHKRSIPTNLERELLAQGMGNVIAGGLGGMPMTGVMIRSAANFEAGARGRASSVFHGVFVALSVILFPQALEMIPLATLAGVLVVTGWRLLNVGTFIKEMRESFRSSYLWPVTTVAILGTDLLRGFGFGVAVWLVAASVRRYLKQRRNEECARKSTVL
jgi:MFS superfamily sulfate permease-like transporter